MAALLDSLRGTLTTVIVAADHVAWWVEWQAGGRRCARVCDAGGQDRGAAATEASAA